METSFKKLSHIFCQIYFMTTWSWIKFFLTQRPWDKFLTKDVEKDVQNLGIPEFLESGRKNWTLDSGR